ncbi:MAG: GNAT family N-acetyltransferase [Chloroflexi bacterium]|nr:GNAT family N-acetyltransferase [Chloroflexota bacterium]
MILRDRAAALRIVREVLAVDYACDERAFLDEHVVVTSGDIRPGGRHYARPERTLEVATMGAGVVVHCHPDRVRWVAAHLAPMRGDAIFAASTAALVSRHLADDGLELGGPNLNYVCPEADLRAWHPPMGIKIAMIGPSDIHALYRHRGFPNALAYRDDSPVADVLAAVATRGDELVGIAGASADSNAMWQIGIDVSPRVRAVGIGRALLSRLTDEVLKTGHQPFYAHGVSNVPSGALAMTVGYRLAWVELYAKDRMHPERDPR